MRKVVIEVSANNTDPDQPAEIYSLIQENGYPVSILHKSIAGRYRPVRVADGPITARCRFIKNASWVHFVIFYSTQWCYKRTVKVLIRPRMLRLTWAFASAYVRRHVSAWCSQNQVTQERSQERRSDPVRHRGNSQRQDTMAVSLTDKQTKQKNRRGENRSVLCD